MTKHIETLVDLQNNIVKAKLCNKRNRLAIISKNIILIDIFLCYITFLIQYVIAYVQSKKETFEINNIYNILAIAILCFTCIFTINQVKKIIEHFFKSSIKLSVSNYKRMIRMEYKNEKLYKRICESSEESLITNKKIKLGIIKSNDKYLFIITEKKFIRKINYILFDYDVKIDESSDEQKIHINYSDRKIKIYDKHLISILKNGRLYYFKTD